MLPFFENKLKYRILIQQNSTLEGILTYLHMEYTSFVYNITTLVDMILARYVSGEQQCVTQQAASVGSTANEVHAASPVQMLLPQFQESLVYIFKSSLS